MPESERVLIFDFGSQYGQLIARRVREQNVFCQIVRHDLPAERVAELKPQRHHLLRRPGQRLRARRPALRPALFDLGIPVLGICYGMQLACQVLGGEVKPAAQPRVRPGHLPASTDAERPVRGRAGRDDRLDEPRRPGADGRRRLRRRWPRPTPARSPPSRHRTPAVLRPAVPPGGQPHARTAARSSATSSTTSAAATGSWKMQSFIDADRRRAAPTRSASTASSAACPAASIRR